jgi:hypothetical protein
MNAGRFEQVGTPQELYLRSDDRVRCGIRRREQPVPGRVARVDGEVVDVATADGLVASRAGKRHSSPSAMPREAFVRRKSIDLARDASELSAASATFRDASRASFSTARTRRCSSARTELGGVASRCRRPGASPISPSDEAIASASMPGAPCASAPRSHGSSHCRHAARTRDWRSRCLLAHSSGLLVGLIVLPHVELAILSLRARVAPRVYEWSLDPIPDVRRRAALLADVRAHSRRCRSFATVCTVLIAFPAAWYIAEDRARTCESRCCSYCA